MQETLKTWRKKEHIFEASPKSVSFIVDALYSVMLSFQGLLMSYLALY
jgi:hypothetical protein